VSHKRDGEVAWAPPKPISESQPERPCDGAYDDAHGDACATPPERPSSLGMRRTMGPIAGWMSLVRAMGRGANGDWSVVDMLRARRLRANGGVIGS
jgi:hypothetical protein